MSLVKKILIGLIRAYQWLVSPILPMSCRYHPSCSHYACEAIRRHGALAGGWLAFGRLLRCHPWGGDGWDPVPERIPVLTGAGPALRHILDRLLSGRVPFGRRLLGGPQRPCGGES